MLFSEMLLMRCALFFIAFIVVYPLYAPSVASTTNGGAGILFFTKVNNIDYVLLTQRNSPRTDYPWGTLGGLLDKEEESLFSEGALRETGEEIPGVVAVIQQDLETAYYFDKVTFGNPQAPHRWLKDDFAYRLYFLKKHPINLNAFSTSTGGEVKDVALVRLQDLASLLTKSQGTKEIVRCLQKGDSKERTLEIYLYQPFYELLKASFLPSTTLKPGDILEKLRGMRDDASIPYPLGVEKTSGRCEGGFNEFVRLSVFYTQLSQQYIGTSTASEKEKLLNLTDFVGHNLRTLIISGAQSTIKKGPFSFATHQYPIENREPTPEERGLVKSTFHLVGKFEKQMGKLYDWTLIDANATPEEKKRIEIVKAFEQSP